MKKHFEFKAFKGNKTLYITLFVCLLVFFVSIYVLIFSFNQLIERHDQRISGEICNVVSEKISNSLSASNNSLVGIASVIEAQDFDSPEEIYEILTHENTYASMGFVDENKNIYGTDLEKAEFERWGFLELLDETEQFCVSAPYRTSSSGLLVDTMFVRVKYAGSKYGWIFATRNFRDMQDAATTSVFLNDMDVWLMDSQSANLILCNGSDTKAIGNWANGFLSLLTLDDENRQHFVEMYKEMKKGIHDIGMFYQKDNIYYSVYGTAIESMPGWYVVVRIPSGVLSETMNTFRNYVFNYLVVIVLMVAVLFVVMYRLSKMETERLEDISIHDPLTRLLNRRGFDRFSQKWLDSHDKAALIFIDVDYFKQINDGLGHDAGDILLTEFARILGNYLGVNSLFFRVGGDEFVALVELESKEELDERIGHAREDIRNIQLPDFKNKEGSDIREISFSAGIAYYPKDASDLSTLKKCADTALYIVKERGRNGYCWYSEL